MGSVGKDITPFGRIPENAKDEKRQKEASSDMRMREDDASQRREATYRAERARLNGAIDNFYKQVGVTPPPASSREPGAYTTRPLSESDTLPMYDKEEDVYGVIPKKEEASSEEPRKLVEKSEEASEEGTKAVDPKKIRLIKKLASELEKDGTKR